jgi:hypothetical protein
LPFSFGSLERCKSPRVRRFGRFRGAESPANDLSPQVSWGRCCLRISWAGAGSPLSSEAKSGELPVSVLRTMRFPGSILRDSARHQVDLRRLLLQRVPGTWGLRGTATRGSITLRQSLVAFEPPGSRRRGLRAVAVPGKPRSGRPTPSLQRTPDAVSGYNGLQSESLRGAFRGLQPGAR